MESEKQNVVLSDIRIPFWRLVAILVKIGIAALPATIIVSFVLSLVMFSVMALFGMGRP